MLDIKKYSNDQNTTMTVQRSTTLLFLSTLVTLSKAASLLADCSSCDHTLTQELYYGCSGDSAYVTYNGNKVECGQALTFDEIASAPKFHFPDAEADAQYTLLMMDTTGIDPIVGSQPPFLPFPIIHYGAINIPGDHLVDGLSLDKFSKDDTGVRVTPFLSYQAPVPLDDLSKYQPGFDPPDINTRAFNYEFILGKQRRVGEQPLMDKTANWEFVGFLKTRVNFPPMGKLVSTYISSGYCVGEVDNEESAADCPVPDQTGSGMGSIPAHVATAQGGLFPIATGNDGNTPDDGAGDELPTAGAPSGTGGSEGDTEDQTKNSSVMIRGMKSAAVVSSVMALLYGLL